ncbi:hypothetical protein PAPYR_4505 [Paratrimastix pyriformis]|uniref:4Fe-4S dicluster domain-containing protein n=1 Tax=Paratrimastix pyriformis TaxID=342808 RepID=A0ABQ8UKW8_9EUKA|nr:hypothetical protein PAPYR_4505 [Paratrimastix pyriformis]
MRGIATFLIPGMSKQVLLVHCSLTGNTQHVALVLKQVLEAHGFSCVLHDLIPLIRGISLRSEAEPLAELTRKCDAADVIGLGTLVDGLAPFPKFCKAISALPKRALQGKPSFIFTTFGNIEGWASATVVNCLKKMGSRPLMALPVRCPENFIPLQAIVPDRDYFDAGQETRVRQFAEKLSAVLGSEPSSWPQVELALWKRVLARIGWSSCVSVVPLIGPIRIDPAKCIHCGACVRLCPFGALEKCPDIENTPAGPPQYHMLRCKGCTRCLNRCPAQAISIPVWRSQSRQQYTFTEVRPQGLPHPLREIARVRHVAPRVLLTLAALVVILVGIALRLLRARRV